MTEQPELGACPFCGAVPAPFDGDQWVTHRAGCFLGQQQPTHWFVCDRTRSAWNRRAPCPDCAELAAALADLVADHPANLNRQSIVTIARIDRANDALSNHQARHQQEPRHAHDPRPDERPYRTSTATTDTIESFDPRRCFTDVGPEGTVLCGGYEPSPFAGRHDEVVSARPSQAGPVAGVGAAGEEVTT